MKHHDDPPTPEELAALETEFQVLFEQTCEPPSNAVIERLSHHAERVVDQGRLAEKVIVHQSVEL